MTSLDPNSTDDASVRALLAACRAGEPDAQRRLFDQFSPRVYRLLWRMAGREEAADLMQQVFLQAFRKLHQFQGDARFETWLYRIAVNEVLQHRRREQRHRVVPLEHDPADELSPTHESPNHQELLDMALGRIDDDLRSTFVLREVEQLSYREISTVLRISEGTVASRLSRARRELQRHLIDLGWRP